MPGQTRHEGNENQPRAEEAERPHRQIRSDEELAPRPRVRQARVGPPDAVKTGGPVPRY